MKRLGVDIGGSHISAAEIRFRDNTAEVLNFKDSEVNTFGDLEEIISTWTTIILDAAAGEKNFEVGIAMPGPFDYPNGISLIKDQGKMASLINQSVKLLLSESLGISPNQIQFTNDAEAFLIGESYAGAGRDFSNSIGITLGTGLGSAIKVEEVVKDAKLWTAPFKDGIAEDYLGTSWFKKYSEENFGLQIKGVKDLLNSGFEKENSSQIFETFGIALGEFLFPYLVRLQSQGVVLGGKIALASEYFLPFTFDYLKLNGYSVPIKISELGEQAALIGASMSFNSIPRTY